MIVKDLQFLSKYLKYLKATATLGTVCPIAREKRLEREEHWMKTLRTRYPYGLNDRAKGEDANKSVGLQFLSRSRGAARNARPRTKPSIYNLT